jgi:hypothetical protein
VARSDRTDRWTFVLGIVTLAAYLAQARWQLTWPWLVEQQRDDTYKIASGCVLALYLAWQWSLRSRRLFDPAGAVRRHKLAGACAPLVLYAHASQLAYGYLLVLAFAYLGAATFGLLHRVAQRRGRGAFAAWFILHVASVTVLVFLVAYHVVIAIAYE